MTKGKKALVDDGDFEYLSQWKWHIHSTGYAIRSVDGGHRKILMHRFIMDTPEGLETDHMNHDRLDNRRSNLKVCTKQENLSNPGVYRGGVYWHKQAGKWHVQVQRLKKRQSYGLFTEKSDALQVLNQIKKGFIQCQSS